MFAGLVTSSQGQQLKLVNLNTHDTLKTEGGKAYYFGVQGEQKTLYGKIIALGDSSIEAGGRKIPLDRLLWLSSTRRKPRPFLNKASRAAVSLYGLSILLSGIYYYDNFNSKPLTSTALYGAGIAIPAGLWLLLHREPEFNLRGSWIAIVER